MTPWSVLTLAWKPLPTTEKAQATNETNIARSESWFARLAPQACWFVCWSKALAGFSRGNPFLFLFLNLAKWARVSVIACQCHILQKLQCFQTSSVASLAFFYYVQCTTCTCGCGIAGFDKNLSQLLCPMWPAPDVVSSLRHGPGPFPSPPARKTKLGWVGSCRSWSVAFLLHVHWPSKFPTLLPGSRGSWQVRALTCIPTKLQRRNNKNIVSLQSVLCIGAFWPFYVFILRSWQSSHLPPSLQQPRELLWFELLGRERRNSLRNSSGGSQQGITLLRVTPARTN